MNKKYIAFFSLLIILAFIGYIIYDTAKSENDLRAITETNDEYSVPDQWILAKELVSGDGPLSSVTVSGNNDVYLGGDSYISCYDSLMQKVWSIKTTGNVTSLSIYGDTIYCATSEMILLYSNKGKLIDEWGPFEDKSLITSVASNKSFVAFADAGNKLVFVLTKDGRVKSMIGQTGEKFIIPSLYFDVAIDENNTLYIANTGNRRVETRSIGGDLISYFGSPGIAPDAFCGCCNPAHFTLFNGGFLTAEKGINRIKILNEKGNFVEFVSSKNKFTVSIPLDIATSDGKTIYAANPADSKLYVFKRKN